MKEIEKLKEEADKFIRAIETLYGIKVVSITIPRSILEKSSGEEKGG